MAIGSNEADFIFELTGDSADNLWPDHETFFYTIGGNGLRYVYETDSDGEHRISGHLGGHMSGTYAHGAFYICHADSEGLIVINDPEYVITSGWGA